MAKIKWTQSCPSCQTTLDYFNSHMGSLVSATGLEVWSTKWHPFFTCCCILFTTCLFVYRFLWRVLKRGTSSEAACLSPVIPLCPRAGSIFTSALLELGYLHSNPHLIRLAVKEEARQIRVLLIKRTMAGPSLP